MMVVKNEFANAFYALHEAPKRLKEEFDEDQLKSYRGPLLKVIIEINPRQIQERNWLRGMSFMHPMLMNPVCGDVHNVIFGFGKWKNRVFDIELKKIVFCLNIQFSSFRA